MERREKDEGRKMREKREKKEVVCLILCPEA
jgi:hypothetical protein